jgi:hypothetical protein
MLRLLPLALGLALAACGATSERPAVSEWQANATGAAQQLRGDAGEVAGLDRISAARAALHDESRLFVLLVAFGDLGGCRHMRASLGRRPPGVAAADGLFGRACAHAAQAASLFTRAVAGDDPAALVDAAREARTAIPFLERAELALPSRRRQLRGS